MLISKRNNSYQRAILYVHLISVLSAELCIFFNFDLILNGMFYTSNTVSLNNFKSFKSALLHNFMEQ